jgi:hypothetical protein
LSCKLHKLGMHGEQASKAAPTTGEAGCWAGTRTAPGTGEAGQQAAAQAGATAAPFGRDSMQKTMILFKFLA